MTDGKPPMDEKKLMAFADKRLSPEAAREVAQYLEAHPDKAEEVAQWQRQNEAVNALFPPVPSAPLPDRLNPHRIAHRRNAGLDWRQMAAAAVVLFGLGTGAGWLGHEVLQSEPSASYTLLENAVVAHALYILEARHAVEVAGNEEDHLVTWLSNRIARPIGAPDLTAEGFTLVGGRLLPPDATVATGPAAQLMYEDQNSQRVTVYVTAALGGDDDDDRFVEDRGFYAYYWSNDQITCTVVGSLPPDQMKAVARQIYRQLTAHSGSV